MVCRATMATMASELVGNQCRPDLLDAPITILSIFIDSIAAATQNGVSKMSTVLQHSAGVGIGTLTASEAGMRPTV
jgi:hypothetical protein